MLRSQSSLTGQLKRDWSDFRRKANEGEGEGGGGGGGDHYYERVNSKKTLA